MKGVPTVCKVSEVLWKELIKQTSTPHMWLRGNALYFPPTTFPHTATPQHAEVVCSVANSTVSMKRLSRQAPAAITLKCYTCDRRGTEVGISCIRYWFCRSESIMRVHDFENIFFPRDIRIFLCRPLLPAC